MKIPLLARQALSLPIVRSQGRSLADVLAPKSHPNLLHVEQTILVVVDMQEPFLRHIYEPERVVQNVCTLMQGANTLRVPVIATTQYAEKMGDLLPQIKKLVPSQLPPFDKMRFSCYGDPAFASEINRSGRKQILLCGVESHICVSQTAHELLAAGFQVHVAADAISSRSDTNWRLGIEKMRQAGVLLTSVEGALYELMEVAGTPEFKELLKLIK
jgi:nicotinamidase-related amidase